MPAHGAFPHVWPGSRPPSKIFALNFALVYLLWRNIFPEQLASVEFGKYTERMKYGHKRDTYIGDELLGIFGPDILTVLERNPVFPHMC